MQYKNKILVVISRSSEVDKMYSFFRNVGLNIALPLYELELVNLFVNSCTCCIDFVFCTFIYISVICAFYITMYLEEIGNTLYFYYPIIIFVNDVELNNVMLSFLLI